MRPGTAKLIIVAVGVAAIIVIVAMAILAGG